VIGRKSRGTSPRRDKFGGGERESESDYALSGSPFFLFPSCCLFPHSFFVYSLCAPRDTAEWYIRVDARFCRSLSSPALRISWRKGTRTKQQRETDARQLDAAPAQVSGSFESLVTREIESDSGSLPDDRQKRAGVLARREYPMSA